MKKLAVVIQVTCLWFVVASSSVAQNSIDVEPSLLFDQNSSVPVISYSVLPAMIAEQYEAGPPLLRIYGDGRVIAHYPKFMKKAGDYEMTLTKSELDALMNEVGRSGVIEFNPAEIEQKKINYMAQLSASAETSTGFPVLETDISDDDLIVLEINASEYTNEHGISSKGISKRIEAANIEHEAAEFPSIPALSKLKSINDRLQQLLEDNRLKRS